MVRTTLFKSLFSLLLLIQGLLPGYLMFCHMFGNVSIVSSEQANSDCCDDQSSTGHPKGECPKGCCTVIKSTKSQSLPVNGFSVPLNVPLLDLAVSAYPTLPSEISQVEPLVAYHLALDPDPPNLSSLSARAPPSLA